MLERIDKHSVITKYDWKETLVILVSLSFIIGGVLYCVLDLCSAVLDYFK